MACISAVRKCSLMASSSLMSSPVSALKLGHCLPFSSVNNIWCTLDPGGGRRWISRAVLTSFPPLPRQRQHGGSHYISAPTSSFVIEIVEAVLSSAVFSWGPHLALPNGSPFNFSNGEQSESLCDGSKPQCGLQRCECAHSCTHSWFSLCFNHTERETGLLLIQI